MLRWIRAALVVALGVTPAWDSQANFGIYQFNGGIPAVAKSLVSDFGGHCNGDVVIATKTLTISSGSAALAASTATWSAGDVGKVIAVSGAGTSGGVLNTKIDAFTDTQHITLHNTASTTLSASSQAIGYGTDDTPAFQAFNDWVFANSSINSSDKIILTLPTNGTCQWLSSVNSSFAASFNSFAVGVKSLQVQGNGSTLTNYQNTAGAASFWPTFFLGSGGVFFDNLHDGRISTVSSGSTSVTLTNSTVTNPTPCAPNCQSLFSVGTYALIAGVDQQGFGDPPNPFYYEYVKITGISGANITLQSPLKNTYKSTWPLWNAGDASHSDEGGPATLYALNPLWDASFEYDNLTIDQAAQTLANGRIVTYSGVTFAGSACLAPSQNSSLSLISANTSTCSNGGSGVELDKIVDQVTVTGGSHYGFFSQSASVNTLTINGGATINTGLQGTPKNFVGNNVTIATLKVGTTSYGRSDSFSCTGCAITTFQDGGVFTQHISSTYTMSGGVISSASGNPQPWAMPGTNLFWRGAETSESVLQVTDISQSGSTQLSMTANSPGGGGFPTLPLSGSSDLGLYVHPAPKFTCSGCTGNATVVSLSNAPANAPLYSYQTYIYSGSIGAAVQPTFEMWGNLSSVSVNVTNAYTGVGSLSFCLSQFNNWVVVNNSGNGVNFGPCVNAKVAGNRVMTRSGVTCNGSAGTCDAGDTGWTVPDATKTWFTGASQSGPIYSADVSASCPGAGCPSITVTMQADQGLVIP